jgi:peptide deformylase
MAVLDIVTIGEPILRSAALPVTEDELRGEDFQQLIDDLVETMRAANGAGLAAPQVGVGSRVYVVEVRDNPRYPYKPELPLRILVNPVVQPISEETFEVSEGCLSIPDLRGRLTRAAEVEVQYTTREGERRSEVFRGLSAGTFQHEQDHLDGILFVDRVEDPRTLTTWEAYRLHHEAEWRDEARAIVARYGS